MIPIPYTTLIEYKSMRAEPSVRIILDLGEVSKNVVAKLHEMKQQGGGSVILSDSKEFIRTIHQICTHQGIPFPENLISKLDPADLVYLQDLTGQEIAGLEEPKEEEDYLPAEDIEPVELAEQES